MTKSLTERQPSLQRESDMPTSYEINDDAQKNAEVIVPKNTERTIGFTALGGPISERELKTPYGVYLFPTEM